MIHIFGGGTISHVANHFMVGAWAEGGTARKIHREFTELGVNTTLHLTRQADHDSTMYTNADVEQRLREVLADPNTAAVIFNVALCDFDATIPGRTPGKYADRLESRGAPLTLELIPSKKVLPLIKQLRPDVIAVGFKTTANATLETQQFKVERQIKETGVDLVFANDTVSRRNFLSMAQGSEVVHHAPMARESVLIDLYDQLAIRLLNRGGQYA